MVITLSESGLNRFVYAKVERIRHVTRVDPIPYNRSKTGKLQKTKRKEDFLIEKEINQICTDIDVSPIKSFV